ncbi:hypothetical protein OHA25_15820 [Nonomuraea sp. NBC_00507]|uniref:ISAzo13-like element transposase-related protein n=1 Tax=Nonomuraea sp. NBC_00507 TaxID=2976002 RepID=UPI002E173E35
MPHSGPGRKRAEQVDPRPPAALDALDALVKPATPGDPESPPRWTTWSMNTLATEFTRQGIRPVTTPYGGC